MISTCSRRGPLNFRNFVVPCIILIGLFVPANGLIAENPKTATEPDQKQATSKENEVEKSEDDESTPPKETREERRQRLRIQAGSGLGSTQNLIGIPRIQRELNLSDEQQKEIADQTRKIRLHVRFKSKDVIDLPRGQQAAQMRKIQIQTRPFVKEKQKEMMKVLSEEQRLRLLGISLQMRGPKSLLDEGLVELLELTDEQVEQILAILEQYDAKLQKTDSPSRESPDQPLILIQPVNSRRQLNAEAEEKILAVLTAEQRETFKKLQGAPFDVQPVGDGRLPTLIEPSADEEKQPLEKTDSEN